MVFARSRRLSQLYRRLETPGKPWVAAINGAAMGGVRACARLPSAHRGGRSGSRLGLPEITVGLFTGAGGTQRIPRMIGRPKR